MPGKKFNDATRVIISTTFVSLLAVPIVGPALSTMQSELGINNRDIGWMVMSSYTLPALLVVPIIGYLADRFGKKTVLLPSLIIFGICGGLVSLAPNNETLICLRFFQGVGGSALATLNTALIPDLFKGRDRIKVMGFAGGTQSIGAGVLPLIGGLLASVTWFLPFTTALIAIPVGIYILFILQIPKPDSSPRKERYIFYAWQHLANQRVMELCFFTFGFIFAGFGCFISYIPSIMHDNFGSGPFLIGIIISARAITGALTAIYLNQLTLLVSSRALIVSSFLILAIGMVSLPLVTSQWGILFSALCYGASFGITRPLIQVHLFEMAPNDLRATFSSAIGVAVRFAQTLSPLMAGLIVATLGFEILYVFAALFATAMAVLALLGKSLSPGNTKII